MKGEGADALAGIVTAAAALAVDPQIMQTYRKSRPKENMSLLTR